MEEVGHGRDVIEPELSAIYGVDMQPGTDSGPMLAYMGVLLSETQDSRFKIHFILLQCRKFGSGFHPCCIYINNIPYIQYIKHRVRQLQGTRNTSKNIVMKTYNKKTEKNIHLW